jgi:hypothetical protein
MPAGQPPDGTLFCSFCHKSQEQVRKLVAGSGVYICDECVDACVDIISDDRLADPNSAAQVEPLTSPMLTARCSLCHLVAAPEELVAVIGRGALCRPCIAAVQRTPFPQRP